MTKYTHYVSTDYVPERHEGNIIPYKIYPVYKSVSWPTNIVHESGIECNIAVDNCAYLDMRNWKQHTKQEYLRQLRGE